MFLKRKKFSVVAWKPPGSSLFSIYFLVVFFLFLFSAVIIDQLQSAKGINCCRKIFHHRYLKDPKHASKTREPPESLRKQRISTNFPHEEKNFRILHSEHLSGGSRKFNGQAIFF